MRFIFFVFFLTSYTSTAQGLQKFGSPIFAYHGIGHSINKQPNLHIIQSNGVKIEDRDSCYQILGGYGDDLYVVTAYILNSDTLHKQQYNYKFMYLPDPKIHWKVKNGIRISSDFNEDFGTIGIHKDSLRNIQEIEAYATIKHLPNVNYKIEKSTIYYPNLRGSPLAFEGSTIPDSIIDRLNTLGDTLGLSITSVVRGEDMVARQIGGFVEFIKLEGLQFEVQKTLLFLQRFSDTIEVSKKELFSNDTLKLHNPGRLFLKLPRIKKDYYVKKWHDETSYFYEVGYTKIEAGKGHFIFDCYRIEGTEKLLISFDENPYEMDLKTFKQIDKHVNKKNFIFTYPKP